MAKLTFETDLCKGCGLCVNACPKGCLTIASDKINKKGYSPAVMMDEESASAAPSALPCAPTASSLWKSKEVNHG